MKHASPGWGADSSLEALPDFNPHREGTMPFVLEDLIRDAIRATMGPVRKIRRRKKRLASHIDNSAESMGLNFYEGNYATKGHRTNAFGVARKEANEARGGLLIAEAKGYVTMAEIERPVELLTTVSKILWKLIR